MQAAIVGAVSSLLGAGVGWWATLKASRESFDKQREYEGRKEREKSLGQFDAYRFAVSSEAGAAVTYDFAVKLRDVMFENKWLLAPEPNLAFFNAYLIRLPDSRPQWSDQVLATLKDTARRMVVPEI